MKKFLFCFFSILIGYLLQTTAFSFFSIGSIRPNLMIMITCIIGFTMGKKPGIFAGFVSGLLIDLLAGETVGFTSLVFMYIGFFNGIFTKDYDKEQLLLPLSIVAAADFIYETLYYVFYFMLHNKLNFGYYFRRIILPELIYTVLITLVLYLLIYRIVRMVEFQKKRRATLDVK